MTSQKQYAHYFIICGLVAMLVAVGQLGEGRVAWADGTYFQTVPTRTPTPGNSNDSDNNNDEETSAIIGQVTDLSTGQPGAGIIVRINDIDVRTDTAGKYSLSGLRAGAFEVRLALENGAVASQDPIVVNVDGRTDTTVDLTYFSDPSQAQANPTSTPQPEAEPTSTPNTAAAVTDATATPAPEAEATATPAAEPTATTVVESTATTAPAEEPAATTQTSEQPKSPEALPVSGGVNYSFWVLLLGGLASLLVGLKLKRSQSQS